jgi:tRNA(His) 5'-end guanylyltransferase
MQFKNLEDKCLHYRSLTDYKLVPNSYVIVMVDGRSFSSLVKNKFQKPFDDNFINMMNATAAYLCENIQGCKFAYVQSDEISLVLTDFDTPTTDSFFGNRLTKMLSIIASLATAKFNQMMLKYRMENGMGINPGDIIDNTPLYQFDCKCWNVPSFNDVFAWFLYRQIDCVKNSKQQTAQTYLPHKQLVGKDTDSQIELLLNEKGIDWNTFTDEKKYGRFLWKELLTLTTDTGEEYLRHKWTVHPAFLLTGIDGRDKFCELNVIPQL